MTTDDIENTKNRDRMLVDDTDGSRAIESIAYKYFSHLFEDRDELIESYQNNLKAAHMPISADLYLSKTILFTLVSLVSSLFVLSGIIGFLFTAGYLELVSSSSTTQILVGVGGVIFGSLFVSLLTGGLYYIRPSYVASRRAAQIDATLPSAITLMYALDKGGMTLVDVFRTLAENEETYGEVAVEFQAIMQDIDFFSRDIMDSLQRARDRTPSEKFSDFIDDAISTMDSGASTSTFFKNKSEDLVEEAEREQENFVETLSLLGEVYVTAFVAGPLFLIIMTVIMAFIGGSDPDQLDGIVYALLPLMNIGYFFLIDILAGSDPDTARTLEADETFDLEEFKNKTSEETENIENIISQREKERRLKLIREPFEVLLDNPDKILIFTVPLSLLYIGGAVLTGQAGMSVDAFVDDPVVQTIHLLLIPLYISILPLSILYEIKSRNDKKIINRLPDALKTLASANQVGMTLTEALENTADNTTGLLGEELRRVKNDIRWKYDVNTALVNFSNRIKVPILTRTVKLITEANKSTGAIGEVIQVAADNVSTQIRLKKERASAMSMYTGVILISFVIYLGVVAILDITFLSEIGDMDGGDFDDGGGDGGLEISDLPVDRFRLTFYHSSIVQAIGSGLIAGVLSANDPRAGLKFVIVLTMLATGVFYVVA